MKFTLKTVNCLGACALGPMVVVDEDYVRCGPHTEIAFQVQERAFKSLKAPMQRVGNLNTPIPMAKILHEAVLPTKDKIMAAVKKTLGYS